MANLTIYRGLPGSGKTTAARQVVDAAEPGTVVRLNRDDLRRSMLTSGYSAMVHDAEQRITTARNAALAALLAAECDVICDDTNLRAKYVKQMMVIAEQAGATVEFVDFTDVPLEECLRRDSERTGVERVGEATIRDMHARHLAALGGGPLPVPGLTSGLVPGVEPYVPTPGTPRAFLCDVDGTVALLNGRNPYDETLVRADLPNTPVIETAHALISSGLQPVFLSGRTEGCREATEGWLCEHVLPPLSGGVRLHMRATGDHRPDHVVKAELFDAKVRNHYDVRMVLDDRNSVVALWRSMGLTCLQAAPGDF